MGRGGDQPSNPTPPADEDLLEEWRRLRARRGARATVIDMYELAAFPRGLRAHQLSFDERQRLTTLVLPEVYPGFEVTVESDRAAEPIELVPYDERWPRVYERWRTRLAKVLPATTRIEHIGSTSIPGIDAKPVVDIQVSVPDLENEVSYVPAIESTGLRLRSRDEMHRFFRNPGDQPREVHVHAVTAGGQWEWDHLLFRDYLRAHADARQRYIDAKRQAAAVWWDDRQAYTDAKTDAVLDLLEAATAWADAAGWSLQ